MRYDLASSRRRPQPDVGRFTPRRRKSVARKLLLLWEFTMLKVRQRAQLIAAIGKAAMDIAGSKASGRASAANRAPQLRMIQRTRVDEAT